MQRTLTNLLENSLHHVQRGATVEVTLQQNETDIVLIVEDSGAGFSEELLPRIFDRYAKGDASLGHGLGLAFVSAVVRSHGGSVIANNRPAGGASIRIELPGALQASEWLSMEHR